MLDFKPAHTIRTVAAAQAAQAGQGIIRRPASSLFDLGRVVMTAAVQAAMLEGRVNPAGLIARHVVGDWGEGSDEHDRKLNDDAVKSGEDRIFSVYLVGDVRVWVITEWDRSATTVLFPSEY